MPTSSKPSATSSTTDLATRRRAEILAGAVAVISRDGLGAAKLKDIARESGVSLGLVQHYFDSRQNLVDETFTAMMQVISTESARRLGSIDNPLEAIYAVNRVHAYGAVDFPGRWGFWTELWAATTHRGATRGTAVHVYHLWADSLQSALTRLTNAGQLPSTTSTQALSITHLALMDGLSIRALTEPEAVTSEVMLEILDEWVSLQYRVSPRDAQAIKAELATRADLIQPTPLTTDIIASAIVQRSQH